MRCTSPCAANFVHPQQRKQCRTSMGLVSLDDHQEWKRTCSLIVCLHYRRPYECHASRGHAEQYTPVCELREKIFSNTEENNTLEVSIIHEIQEAAEYIFLC
jgi:hypothetical protein